MEKSARRAAVAAYKEKKKPAGVYAVRCVVTGEAWVGPSPNLDCQKTSLWFQLRHAGLPNESLRASWSAYGERAFRFETLEQAPEDLTPSGVQDFLKRRAHHWRETLDAGRL